MIFFWNRKEVYFGTSLQKFGEVQSLLSANKLNFTYRIINMNGSSSLGRVGQKAELAYEYYIYVHKKDYEDALSVINKL